MRTLLLSLLSLATAILVRQPAPEVLSTAINDELLAEIKHRVELCEETDYYYSGSPLAHVSLDALFAELKRREAEKICETPSQAPLAPAPGGAPAPAPTTQTTTTTTTTPCPSDNFMDEVVDQANPEFDMLDANKDGCLTEEEMTATLRRQREVARERDYYWVRKNITGASRQLENQWHAHHNTADENGSGCLNKEELDIIQHAVCDCGTQFLFMDHNADDKISQQEAATYVSEHMSHADLNYVKLRAIWKVADVDQDGFLSPTEFCEAGPRYKGDGDETADEGGTDEPDPLLGDA